MTASNIKGLKVQFAKVGLSGENGLPVISESEFINCSQAGILCNSSVKDINIANCLVSACNTGISINNGSCTVNITDNTITNCSYGITALNNTYNAIVGNKIKTNLATAIEVSGTNPASSVFRNTIGWGTGGVGIICKGMDEIRRNTIQANLCIQVMETAKAVVRSNLMVADKDRNGMGLLFSSSLINSPNLIVQNNGVWNQTLAGKKYGNSFGDAVNVTGDLSFTSTSGPAFQGGDPFTGSITNMNFSYFPSSGSILKHAGFESNEDMGAEDVPN